MKRVGYILIAIGCAFLVYLAFSYFNRNSGIVSPVPEEDGIKVIYLTPGAN